MNDASLDYLPCKEDGYYFDDWSSSREKLCACASLEGPNFKQDSASLYSSLVENIGLTRTVASTVKKTRYQRMFFAVTKI